MKDLPYQQLAKEIGCRLRTIRLIKGIGPRTADAQLNLGAAGLYAFLENGNRLPTPKESERIVRWAFEGFQFRRPIVKRKRPATRKISVHLYPVDYDIVKNKAKSMGMTLDEFIEFACLRFCRDAPVLAHYRSVAKDYSMAKLKHAAKDQNIKALLQFDEELVIKTADRLFEETYEKGTRKVGKNRVLTPEMLLDKLEEHLGTEEED